MALSIYIYIYIYIYIPLTHRYSDQEENGFEIPKFSQKMDIESFPIKSEGFVTGYATIMRVSFMFTLTNPC